MFEHLAIVENPRYEDAFIAVNAYIAKNDTVDANGMKHSETNGQFVSDGDNNSSSMKEWGTAYKEYSGKPQEALEHLLNIKNGYVPAAIAKEGIGNIDFVYGKGGKDGYGLAHIIEQRNKQGIDGEALIRNLPEIIEKGEVILKDKHSDRKYIVSDDKEVAIRLDFNGANRNWIVSAYIKNELQGSNSLNNWHTMLAHDSNLNVANGYVSITTPVTNSITHNQTDFNPDVTINKAVNKYQKVYDYIRNTEGEPMNNETKTIFSQLMDALKARNEAEDEKEKEKEKQKETAANEDVDKRKLIDEVGGILKGKVDEEVWRTIIGKLEKVAYDKSEAGTADNGKSAKNEDTEPKKDDETEKDKEAKNKCILLFSSVFYYQKKALILSITD